MQPGWAAPALPPAPPRRGPFDRLCWWAFIGFQAAILLLMLAACALMLPGPDSGSNAGALFYGLGVIATGALWVLWFVGTPILGLLAFLTRPRAPSA